MSLDPTGYFLPIKDFLFAFLVVYGVLKCLLKHPVIKGFNILIICSVILLPLWGILIASAFGKLDDEQYAVAQVRSMFYILIFFFMISIRVEVLLKMFWINGCVLAIVTLLLFAYGQYNEAFFNNVLYEIGMSSNNYKMAIDREFLGVKVNGLYFTTGSFIILAFIYNLYNYYGRFKIWLSVVLFLAMIFCGSRTPALIQIFILCIYVYDKKVIGKFLTRLGVLIAILSLVILTYSLATEEDAHDVKYENYYSYITEITKDSQSFILGSGVGSTFKAAGNDNKRVAFTELSYMDVLRMYGVPVGIYFILLFFYPIIIGYKWAKDNLFYKRFFLGYFLFLILLGTNPLLLGSPGLTGLTIFMAIVNNPRCMFNRMIS